MALSLILTSESASPSILNIDGRVLVRTGPSTLYVFFRSATASILSYRKSTNNGLTWGFPVSIFGIANFAFAVWFDQWTQGDSGTKIHCVHVETATHDVEYRSLDTATDTLSGTFEVATLTSSTSAACCVITKARGGNLYTAFDIDGGTETGTYRSTDGGATWGVRTNINEAAVDLYQLVPGNYADANDIDAYFWDVSASEISRKFLDDSADTVTETSISTGMTAVAKATVGPQFSVTVRHSDGKRFIAAWNSRDVATADLKCWSDDGTTITALTDIVTNSDDCQCVCLHHDRLTDTLFAYYIGKSDGSEVVGTSTGLYYKTSTDSGVTLSAEQTLISDQAAFMYLGGPPTGSGTPRDVTTWFARDQHVHVLANRVGGGIGRGM